MNNYLKILLLLAFVAIQVVDIAFLDNDEAVASEVHAELGIDFDHGNSGHEIHCGCDIFHHLSPALSGDTLPLNGASAAVWTSTPEMAPSRPQGPPVPPPLA